MANRIGRRKSLGKKNLIIRKKTKRRVSYWWCIRKLRRFWRLGRDKIAIRKTYRGIGEVIIGKVRRVGEKRKKIWLDGLRRWRY